MRATIFYRQDVVELDFDPSSVDVVVFSEADKSDPLNQIRTIVLKAGDLRFSVTGDWQELPELIAAIVMLAIVHASEIRDQIKAER